MNIKLVQRTFLLIIVLVVVVIIVVINDSTNVAKVNEVFNVINFISSDVEVSQTS